MNDNLPPLPPYAPEFKPRWATDPGGYNEEQMKAYARAAIERQSVPALNALSKRGIYDAIRGAYDTGYSDARNAGARAGDSAPGYKGRDIEQDHGDALLSAINAQLASAPQPQPVQEPEYCDPSSTIYKLAEMVMSDCGCSSDHQRLLDRIAARIQSHIDTTPQALAQPQPVQPEGPMAETVEQAARDVAKCLNERDGQGLDLRHVAMLVHYAQQPVQEPVKGWWAHTCPEDGKVDVVNYQLTPADKRAGWVEHEVYRSPQAQPAQPLSADASPISVLLAVEESIKNGECPWQIEQAFDEYEARRQSEITKGTT